MVFDSNSTTVLLQSTLSTAQCSLSSRLIVLQFAHILAHTGSTLFYFRQINEDDELITGHRIDNCRVQR